MAVNSTATAVSYNAQAQPRSAAATKLQAATKPPGSRASGWSDLDNLVLLHPNCHRQVHHLMKLGADVSW
jgi:hypothetical protein